jgi:hypothetical protein
VYYSFSDGQQELSIANSSIEDAFFATDENGDITAWNVWVRDGENHIRTLLILSLVGDDATLGTDIAGNLRAGTWTNAGLRIGF